MTTARVRLKDIAEIAKVSRAAVSRVLLGTGAGRIRVGKEKAELIMKIAKEMNFSPDTSAQMLKGKSSKIIGVLIDSYTPQIRFNVLSVVEKILAKKGFRMIIGQTHDNYQNFKTYIEDFASRRTDGIICFAHEYPGFNISKDLDNFKNVVYVGKPEHENANYVAIDIENGMVKLLNHLKNSGKKRIGLLYSNYECYSNYQRMEGFKRGLLENDLEFDENLIFRCPSCPEAKHYQEAIEILVNKQKVDTIVAGNDHLAVKLIKQLKKLNYDIPKDIAVTGFDNLDIAEIIEPELTTIDQQRQIQGNQIANMILDMIKKTKEDTSQQIYIEPKLIVRDSA